jgi:hypothetical protein
MDGTAFAFRERMNGNHRIIICRFGDPETVHIHPPIGYYVVAYEWMTLFIVQIRTKSIVSPRIKSEKTVKQSLDPFLVVSCWSGYKILQSLQSISGSTLAAIVGGVTAFQYLDASFKCLLFCVQRRVQLAVCSLSNEPSNTLRYRSRRFDSRCLIQLLWEATSNLFFGPASQGLGFQRDRQWRSQVGG